MTRTAAGVLLKPAAPSDAREDESGSLPLGLVTPPCAWPRLIRQRTLTRANTRKENIYSVVRQNGWMLRPYRPDNDGLNLQKPLCLMSRFILV